MDTHEIETREIGATHINDDRRANAPPSRVVIASTGKAGIVIDGMGPDYEELKSLGEFKTIDEWALPPGIWVIELTTAVTKSFGPHGTDYDLCTDWANPREATCAELQAIAHEEYPWDPAIWRGDHATD
jgi:hypothetical protein